MLLDAKTTHTSARSPKSRRDMPRHRAHRAAGATPTAPDTGLKAPRDGNNARAAGFQEQKTPRWAGAAASLPMEVRDAMSEKEGMGGLQEGFGRAERRLGEALDDPGLQGRGAANQLKGGARKAVGKAQTKLDDFREQVADRVSRVGEQTRAVYDRTSRQARQVAQRVEPMVHERPYSSLG